MDPKHGTPTPFTTLSMDFPARHVGDSGARFCRPMLLAALPFLPGHFHLVRRHRDGHGDQAAREPGCTSVGFPGWWGSFSSTSCCSPYLLGFVLLLFPLIVEQGSNDRCRCARLLPKPACVDG